MTCVSSLPQLNSSTLVFRLVLSDCTQSSTSSKLDRGLNSLRMYSSRLLNSPRMRIESSSEKCELRKASVMCCSGPGIKTDSELASSGECGGCKLLR